MTKRVLLVLTILTGMILGTKITKKRLSKKIDEEKKKSDKYLSLFLMMNQWVRAKQENKNITEYIERNNYKSIAIYGMNYVGERLLNELRGSAITVKYAIDKKADEMYSDIDIMFPNDELGDVDAIIVTAISFIDEVKQTLSKKVTCPIISLEDILYEL